MWSMWCFSEALKRVICRDDFISLYRHGNIWRIMWHKAGFYILLRIK